MTDDRGRPIGEGTKALFRRHQVFVRNKNALEAFAAGREESDTS